MRPPGGYQKIRIPAKRVEPTEVLDGDDLVRGNCAGAAATRSARSSTVMHPHSNSHVDARGAHSASVHGGRENAGRTGVVNGEANADPQLSEAGACARCFLPVLNGSFGAKVTLCSLGGFAVVLIAPVFTFQVRACIATTALMATWWILRYVPIGITSFLPVVIFPLCGISAAKDIAASYYNDTVFLLIGTCIIALALERTNALTRLAFRIISALPPRPRVILLVFMIITATLSIFVSNTAAAAVVFPILVQLRTALEDEDANSPAKNTKLANGHKKFRETSSLFHSGSSADGSDTESDDSQAAAEALRDPTPEFMRDIASVHRECAAMHRQWASISGADTGAEQLAAAAAKLAALSDIVNSAIVGTSTQAHSHLKARWRRKKPLANLEQSDPSVPTKDRSREIEELRQYFARAGLGVAFSASMGGMASLTGTGPNVVLAGVASQSSVVDDIDWGLFFLFGFPLAASAIALMWACLAFVRFPSGVVVNVVVIRRRLQRLGPVGQAEAATIMLLVVLVVLWLLRAPGWLPEGFGWAQIAAEPTFVSDATAATFVAILLFALPDTASHRSGVQGTNNCSPELRASENNSTSAPCAASPSAANDTVLPYQTRGSTILDWPYFVARFPHSLVLLIAGGCALSEGFSASGLSDVIVEGVAALQSNGVPSWVLMLVLMLAACSLSQFASNGAAASILVPLAASLGEAESVDPRMFMVPTALACSLAFLLPISTPPNAIAFEAGLVGQVQMVCWGLFFIFGGLMLIASGIFVLGGPILGIGFDSNFSKNRSADLSDTLQQRQLGSHGSGRVRNQGTSVAPGSKTVLQEKVPMTSTSITTSSLTTDTFTTTTTLTTEAIVVKPLHLKDPYYYYSIGASTPIRTKVLSTLRFPRQQPPSTPMPRHSGSTDFRHFSILVGACRQTQIWPTSAASLARAFLQALLACSSWSYCCVGSAVAAGIGKNLPLHLINFKAIKKAAIHRQPRSIVRCSRSLGARVLAATVPLCTWKLITWRVTRTLA
eukprot:INCI9175.1.p1 GENE.INCI9175.1~~INCI9175.1.p1  ORF type:complete len:1011 (+),score=144.58 INCI9175.1:197-3229(+)